MLAKLLISDTVPSVKNSDSARTVLDWMSEFKSGQLPLIYNEEFIGLIHEDDLLECTDESLKASEIKRTLADDLFVFEDNHVYEVIQKLMLHKLDLMPVLDNQNKYIGVITKGDLLEYTSMVLNINEPGGIIVLEVAHHSYSLSEIGRLCESENAKVLSLTVSNSVKASMLNITMKLNVRELSRVLATLERFDYSVVTVVFDTEQLHDYQENYEALIRYLNT